MGQTAGTIVFSNSNGVTFGMQGNTVTAAIPNATTVQMVGSAQPAFRPYAVTSCVMSR